MNNMHFCAAFGAAFSAAFVVAGSNKLQEVGHDVKKRGPAIAKVAK